MMDFVILFILINLAIDTSHTPGDTLPPFVHFLSIEGEVAVGDTFNLNYKIKAFKD